MLQRTYFAFASKQNIIESVDKTRKETRTSKLCNKSIIFCLSSICKGKLCYATCTNIYHSSCRCYNVLLFSLVTQLFVTTVAAQTEVVAASLKSTCFLNMLGSTKPHFYQQIEDFIKSFQKIKNAQKLNVSIECVHWQAVYCSFIVGGIFTESSSAQRQR